MLGLVSVLTQRQSYDILLPAQRADICFAVLKFVGNWDQLTDVRETYFPAVLMNCCENRVLEVLQNDQF